MGKLVIGCGYLGERVARAWNEAGHAVSALTRSAARAEELRRQGIRPAVGDVMDRESLRRLPEAETVLYAVGYDASSGWSRRELVLHGLENVLSEIAARTERFLFISSTSVYGQTSGEWVDESSCCEPVLENGCIALEAEQLVWRHFPREAPGGSRALSLRLAGIYGPRRLLRRIESLRAGDPIAGHPEAWLNLIHVEDAAAAVVACGQRGCPGETYLVCDDRPVRRREYFERLSALAGAPPPRFEPAKEAARTPGLNKRCSNRKLREELGLVLKYATSFEGLRTCRSGLCGSVTGPSIASVPAAEGRGDDSGKHQ